MHKNFFRFTCIICIVYCDHHTPSIIRFSEYDVLVLVLEIVFVHGKKILWGVLCVKLSLAMDFTQLFKLVQACSASLNSSRLWAELVSEKLRNGLWISVLKYLLQIATPNFKDILVNLSDNYIHKVKKFCLCFKASLWCFSRCL